MQKHISRILPFLSLALPALSAPLIVDAGTSSVAVDVLFTLEMNVAARLSGTG